MSTRRLVSFSCRSFSSLNFVSSVSLVRTLPDLRLYLTALFASAPPSAGACALAGAAAAKTTTARPTPLRMFSLRNLRGWLCGFMDLYLGWAGPRDPALLLALVKRRRGRAHDL